MSCVWDHAGSALTCAGICIAGGFHHFTGGLFVHCSWCLARASTTSRASRPCRTSRRASRTHCGCARSSARASTPSSGGAFFPTAATTSTRRPSTTFGPWTCSAAHRAPTFSSSAFTPRRLVNLPPPPLQLQEPQPQNPDGEHRPGTVVSPVVEGQRRKWKAFPRLQLSGQLMITGLVDLRRPKTRTHQIFLGTESGKPLQQPRVLETRTLRDLLTFQGSLLWCQRKRRRGPRTRKLLWYLLVLACSALYSSLEYCCFVGECLLCVHLCSRTSHFSCWGCGAPQRILRTRTWITASSERVHATTAQSMSRLCFCRDMHPNRKTFAWASIIRFLNWHRPWELIS